MKYTAIEIGRRLIVLSISTLTVSSQLEAKPHELVYPKHSMGASKVEIATPQTPAAIRLAPPLGDAGPTRRGHEGDDGVVSSARRAAKRAAREMIHAYGRSETFRAGFFDGVHRSLPRGARFGSFGSDRYQGERDGALEPEAKRLGYELGEAEAWRAAGSFAAGEVEVQFRDLSLEPRRAMIAPRAELDARAIRDLQVPAPRLEDIFAEFPPRQIGLALPFDLDPWALFECSRYADFYDGQWTEPGFAFGWWKRTENGRRVWRELGEEDRARFRQTFDRKLARSLFDARDAVDRFYRRGFARGAEYGRFVGSELSYRRGYHRAFERSFAELARSTFARVYPAAFDERYAAEYSEWAAYPKLELEAVRLTDSSDDGVIEPGELVFASYELVNYGGLGGRFEVTISGPHLIGEEATTMTLERRSRSGAGAPVAVRVRAGLAPRTSSTMRFSVADQHREVPFLIAFPIEIDPRVEVIRRETLAGNAGLRLSLRNISRRSVEVMVDAEANRKTGTVLAVAGTSSARLAPESSMSMAFEVENAEPLSLLGGELEVAFVARRLATEPFAIEPRRDGVPDVQDRVDFRFPKLATDLDSPDMALFLTTLSVADSARDRRRAEDLMLERLRVDWDRAVTARGNPYKSDVKRMSEARRAKSSSSGSMTALGELVVVARGRSGVTDSAVIVGFVPRALALVKELPGTHPFLRKSMKKLVRSLASS